VPSRNVSGKRGQKHHEENYKIGVPSEETASAAQTRGLSASSCQDCLKCYLQRSLLTSISSPLRDVEVFLGQGLCREQLPTPRILKLDSGMSAALLPALSAVLLRAEGETVMHKCKVGSWSRGKVFLGICACKPCVMHGMHRGQRSPPPRRLHLQ
jgi:hypothetical protein